MSKTQPTDRAPRYPVRLSAEMKIEGRVLTCTTKNLSSGGVCLEIDRPLNEGKLIRLTLFLVEDDIETEDARGLDLTGTVQWVAEAEAGHNVGIKFGSLTPAQAASLQQALRVIGEKPA
jgi:hypothetical protein